MSEYFIHSCGTCSSVGEDDSSESSGRVKTMLGLENIPKAKKRKMGKLSQIMYSAVNEALLTVDLPDEFPLAVGTAYGEIDMGIGILEDIFESGGKFLRPIKVQNSVHVSSAGQLGILLHNQGPTLTVSQGKLTSESTLQALINLMDMDDYSYGLMVVGDLFSPKWAEKLIDKTPQLASRLTNVPYYESAAALVLCRKKPKKSSVSWKISGQVNRFPPHSRESKEWYATIGKSISEKSHIFSRQFARIDKEAISEIRNSCDFTINVTHLQSGHGTSMAGSLEIIVSQIKKSEEDTLLVLSRELNEAGIIRCDRVSGS